ncbi:MAG: ThuA domain-containing protein, partial [Clostridia bacterium]
FRHASIGTAQRVLPELAKEYGFEVTITEDASVFNDDTLAQYDVVAFVLTTGDVLGPAQEAAMERFIRGGGGFVGVHSASDTEYSWPFYGGLVGAYFAGHPPGTQTARVIVEDRAHPSTRHFGDEWIVEDEWYFFQENPRAAARVLQSLDRRSHPALAGFQGRGAGEDHPLTWCQEYHGGRSWYTALGHRDEVWEDPDFQRMIAGGILWAARRAEGDCSPARAGLVREVLLSDLVEPVDLEVASDGRIFFIERSGAVKVYDDHRGVRLVLKLDVFTDNEHGLTGMALDPRFSENGYIYLFYSPYGPGRSEFYLSRFTVSGEPGSERIDPATEAVLFKVPTDRATCC